MFNARILRKNIHYVSNFFFHENNYCTRKRSLNIVLFYSRAVVYFIAVFVTFHNCSVLFSELKLFVLTPVSEEIKFSLITRPRPKRPGVES